MSENEQIALIEKAKAIIDSLEKTKRWYKSIALAFTVSFMVFISASGVVVYKQNAFEKEISLKAPLKTVELLKQSNEAFTDAMLNLIDEDYKDAVKEFNEKIKVINDNIFFFTTTRGVKIEQK